MCDAVSIYCSQDSEDCPPLYIQRRFSQADGAAQALKSPGASALPKSYKLKLYGFILMDIPGGSDVKVSACNAGDPGSIPGSGRSTGEQNDYPVVILVWRIPWTEEPGYSLWVHKESDITERLSSHKHTHTHKSSNNPHITSFFF